MTASAILRAPPEIWEIIHKYYIAIPLFFDSDPAEAYGVDGLVQYYSEVAYWRSERTRNALRRVCKSWDVALDAFRYRYICLFDVAHGRVPLDALPMAIRLFVEPDSFCQCKEVCYSERRVFGEARWMSIKKRMAQMLVEAISTSQTPWKLEILEGQLQTPDYLLETLATMCPRIQTLTQRSSQDIDKYHQLVPKTRTLLMDGDWADGRGIAGGLKLTHLTTLLLYGMMRDFHPEEWSLPSLLHLHLDIWGLIIDRAAAELLYRILRCWGRGLRTLSIPCESSLELPNDIWSLVPRVTDVQLPFVWTVVPPIGHPLHVVRLSEILMDLARTFSDVEPRLPFQGLIEDGCRSSIRRIALHEPWRDVLFFSSGIQWDIYTRLGDYCAERGWRLTDRYGSTLDEYLVRLITSIRAPAESHVRKRRNPRRLMSF